MATFAEYVSNRIKTEGDDPSAQIIQLYGALTGYRLEHPISDDLPGLLAVLKLAVETDDYVTIDVIGDVLSNLARDAQMQREMAAELDR